MNKWINESNIDRGIRVVLGVVLLVLSLGGMVTGGLGVLFTVLGAIALLTGAAGICPLYMLFKFRTNKA